MTRKLILIRPRVKVGQDLGSYRFLRFFLWFGFLEGFLDGFEVDVSTSIGVVTGVGLVFVLKGRRQVREIRANCACNQWLRVSGSTVFASA